MRDLSQVVSRTPRDTPVPLRDGETTLKIKFAILTGGGGGEFQKNSRRLELSISEKPPTRKVGTRSRQCRPKVPGGSAFPGARNPRICSIWRFGKIFPAIFPGLSRENCPENPRTDPGNSHSLLEFSENWGQRGKSSKALFFVGSVTTIKF